MNDYDPIASFYDTEHAHFSEDLDMYSNYAELCGGRMLELACGTGRALLPLCRDGYDLTGVDISASMLAIAQQRLQAEGLLTHCQLVQQDMCLLQLEQKFRLAFIAIGSFAHIVTRQKQQRALHAIRAHLSLGGTFILDISNADARYMEELSGQMLHLGTWQNADHCYCTHFVSPAASRQAHLLELTHFYDYHGQGGAIQRTIVKNSFYLFERREIELLLELAGFTVKDIYGDYDFGPYTLESPRMICIAEAR